LFDRVGRDVELTYEGEDLKKAMALLGKMDTTKALADVEAAIVYVGKRTGKRVGVIGYCYGGLLAWLGATRLRPAAAVGYYAGQIGSFAAETPKAPVQLHFGQLDTHIPAEQVEAVHAAPGDMRSSYNPQAAALARGRALDFLKEHLL